MLIRNRRIWKQGRTFVMSIPKDFVTHNILNTQDRYMIDITKDNGAYNDAADEPNGVQ